MECITAYYPMRAIDGEDIPKWQSLREQALEEIISLSGQLVFRLDKLGTANPEFDVVGADALTEFRGEYPQNTRNVLRVRVPLDLNRTYYPEANIGWTSLRALNASMASGLLSEKMHDLFMAANIALPGSVGSPNGLMQDQKWVYKNSCYEEYVLQSVMAWVQRTKWPAVQSLAIADVWNWITDLEGYSQGFSTNTVERALCAFSRLSLGFPEGLFWAVMGIEALYDTKAAGVMQQVKERAQALLGPFPASSKKTLEKMYGYRSRLIHGDLNLSPAYIDLECIEDGRYEEYQDAVFMAIAILLVSLQELARRGWSTLRFEVIAAGKEA